MSTPEKLKCLRKDQDYMTIFGTFRTSFQSRDDKLFAPLRAPNKLVDSLNLGPSSTPFQVSQYTKNDLQWIFKMVLEVQISTRDQDWRTSEDLIEQTLKPTV